MRYFAPAILLLLVTLTASAQSDTVPFRDKAHYSIVFRHTKEYRIYVPKNYENSEKRYPVIYFMHGWGGRHFKDPSAKLDYVKIDSLVQANDVLLVMLDGNIDPDEPRAYNVGNHSDVKFDVQYKDYFPEIVKHIDSTYRTLADRNNRALIGYSMGGFFSTLLAGKYPDMLCAQVNLTGSPEFFVGLPKNHTLYPLRHTYGNLHGVKLRLHNSTAGELADLNRETIAGARREKGISIEYEEFEGGHKVDLPGEIKVFAKAFDFACAAINSEAVNPLRWNHLDMDPDFKVWGYEVRSNKNEPGFIQLRGVSKNGFAITTKKWLPDGPAIQDINLSVTTPPDYQPDAFYSINEYDPYTEKLHSFKIKSNNAGQLKIDIHSENAQISLPVRDDAPELVYIQHRINENEQFLTAGKESRLSLQIYNRGSVSVSNFKVQYQTTIANDILTDSAQWLKKIGPGEAIWITFTKPLKLNPQPPKDAAPHMLRLNLDFKSAASDIGSDEFDLPVFFALNEFTNIRIDDGRSPADSIPVLGEGNGNGVPEPGESIVIYVNNHPVRAYYESEYILKKNEILCDTVLPARWPDGYTLYSRIKIEDNTPKGSRIKIMANYETKEFMPVKRVLHWGNIYLNIK